MCSSDYLKMTTMNYIKFLESIVGARYLFDSSVSSSKELPKNTSLSINVKSVIQPLKKSYAVVLVPQKGKGKALSSYHTQKIRIQTGGGTLCSKKF